VNPIKACDSIEQTCAFSVPDGVGDAAAEAKKKKHKQSISKDGGGSRQID
jgi:hypothetical protein